MNYQKYTFIGLGALVLIIALAAGAYAVMQPRTPAPSTETDATRQQAALNEPSIRTDRFSCSTIAPDAVTQSYSIDIRTNDATIPTKQEQVETLLRSLGATITSTNRNKFNDSEAGYSTIAQVQASLPMNQMPTFIAKLKAGVASPDYVENENSSILSSVWLKQSCDTNMNYLKTFAQSEALYLNQLSLASSTADAAAITEKLTEVRQGAVNYEASLQNLLTQIYQAQIVVSVKQIPG